MMKFALLFVIFGLAVAEEFRWDTVPSGGNSSQCIYRAESRVFGCRGRVGIVECPAVAELAALKTRRFDVYGMGREELVGEVSVPSMRFVLFPRKLDNTTYMNNTVEVEGRQVGLYLYQSERIVESGFRVTDVKCWEKLVELFNSSVADRVVRVENSTEVALFGETLLFDKPVQKRWLGLLGLHWGLGLPLGLGLPFWGWGLGWPLPLLG